MSDIAKLGKRFICFKCGTKFYDLNRPVPACPECGADQAEAPAPPPPKLKRGGKKRKVVDDDDDPPLPKDIDDLDDDDLDDDDLDDDDLDDMDLDDDDDDDL